MRQPEHQDPVRAARDVAAHSIEGLRRSVAFRQLPVSTQAAILGDLGSIQRTFATAAGKSPVAESLVGWRPNLGGGLPAEQPQPAPQPAPPASPRQDATATLASRAGALSDEVNFPAFVAGLIHGTFDAMVDASIRQMETYADLISSVARSIDDFTRDNVSRTQVIDWLAERYPKDFERSAVAGSSEPQLRVRPGAGDDENESPSPAWLADYGLDGEPLTDELVEQELIPAAQRRVGEGRMKSLATMVLLGLNRIVVRDGTISAHVRFRAAARDRSKVIYETGQPSWGERGSSVSALPATMVSTVGVNVQAESELKAELFGEVKINFASETMPLDRFANAAQVSLLETHAKRTTGQNPARTGVSETPAPEPTPAAGSPATAPATAPAAVVGGPTV